MKLKMFSTVRRYEGVKDPGAATKKVHEVFVSIGVEN